MIFRIGSKNLFHLQKHGFLSRLPAGIAILLPLIVLLLSFTPGLSIYAAPNIGPSYRSLPGDRQDYIPAELIKRVGNPNDLFLRSHVALVYDERDDEIIIKRSAGRKMPIGVLFEQLRNSLGTK